MTKKNTVVNFILDETGSMGVIKDATISGFNEYVQSLKNKKQKFLFTLTKFNSERIVTPYQSVDVNKVEKLTDKTYQPDAMTPLYDAVVETVEKVIDEVDGQPSVVVIMTDGQENASVKHNEGCLRDLVCKLQGKGNWTFVFLGANQDSWSTAQKWGIYRGNVLDWQATPGGTNIAFASLGNATASFALTGCSSSKDFFEKEKK